jgi:NAD(P)H-hydrate epimerase
MATAKIITVEKSRYLEEQANQRGLAYAEMMENAGRATARAIDHRLGAKDRQVVVLVGPGNNGGDGLVAAHYLSEMGAHVTSYLWKRSVEDDPNFERLVHDRLAVVWADQDPAYEQLRELVQRADVLVDALLGVGVDRPIEGTLRDLLVSTSDALAVRRSRRELEGSVPTLSALRAPVIVAVDCPSGLNCDTGALDPSALPADVTVTFGHPKVGLLRFPGGEAVGDILVADIGFPPHLVDDVPLEMATPAWVAGRLPVRPRASHKGTYGRALIVAGSLNYVGAATLAGTGATRVGTGLVTMALPMPIQPAVAANLIEATYLLLPHDLGVVAPPAVELLLETVSEYDALLLGPGLTQEDEPTAFVHALLGLEPSRRKARIGFATGEAPEAPSVPDLPPLIIDADGLNALAARGDGWWVGLPAGTILTPHPGEMARLMGEGVTAKEIQADREGIAQRMADRWGVVLLLKGAFTVVAQPGGRVMVLPFANPALATAGSGDVLAGAIAGLLAQGLEPFAAAVVGAYLHALAGELAAQQLGATGVVAGDLPPYLPLAIKRLR